MAMKKSPRAPSIPLDDAIAKAAKVYEKERRHASPTDVVAQNIGYKNANNGAALSALASLRYFGLLERPKEGHLAVSKDVETYLYAPNDEIKADLLRKWMRTPPVFVEILEKYGDGLPSDATLRFDLIGQGFSPSAAEGLISIFKKSAEFAGVYTNPEQRSSQTTAPTLDPVAPARVSDQQDFSLAKVADPRPLVPAVQDDADVDRIPIRLPEGRRAWLIVPSPFFEADKQRLKAQIDLLLTDDE